MSITSQQTQRLLQGNYALKTLGFSLLVARLKQKYANDPTQGTLQDCVNEINTFLGKYSNVMGADFAIISTI